MAKAKKQPEQPKPAKIDGRSATREQKDAAIDHIINELQQGRSLNSIITNRPDGMYLPTRETFMDWVVGDKELSDKYTRAREMGAEVKAEQMEEIASKAKDMFEIQKARLLIDTIKWSLAKQMPRKFGDKIETINQNINTTTIIDWSGDDKQDSPDV